MPDSDAVNMVDVARRAGVSTATVSRALRDMPGVSARTRDRVRQIADELSYVISPEASRLKRGATGRVAVVVPRIDVWFHGTMLAAIDEVLRQADMDVLVYQVDDEEQRSRFFQQLPARRKVDAVVLIALPVLAGEAERLDLLGVEVVVAGGRLRHYPHVEADDHDGATQAVQHLLDLGHRRIAMIRTGDTEGRGSDPERLRGYRDTMAAAGVDVPEEYVQTMPPAVLAGADGVDRLLDLAEPPTAVFACSDEIALSALYRLTERGVRVPGDVSLVGLDGHPLAEMLGISTVSQDVHAQGRLSAELALALLRGEALADTEVVVPSTLVVRRTTGPPPA